MSNTSSNKSVFEHFIFSSLDYLRGVWESEHAVNIIFGLVFLRKLEFNQEQTDIHSPFKFEQLSDWCAKWSKAILNGDNSYHEQIINYTQKIEGSHPSLINIFNHLHDAISEDASSEHLLPFLKELCHNDEIIMSIRSSEFGGIFNTCLNKLAIGFEKKHKKIFTPKPINEILATSLCNQSFSSVIDPAVGFASSLLALLAKQQCDRIHIIDKNPFTLLLARMNMILNGYIHFSFQCACAVSEFSNDEKFDRVICHIPINQRINTEHVKHQSFLNETPELSKSDLDFTCLFLQKLLHLLNEDGKLAIAIPTQYLYQKGEIKKIREYLIKKDWVEQVIALPYGLLQRTSGPISLLVINKQKEKDRRQKTLFINAMDMYLKETTSLRRELTKNSIQAIIQAVINPDQIDYVQLINQVEIVENTEIQINEFNLDAKNYASLTRKKLNELARVGSLVKIEEIILPDQPALWFNSSPSKPYPYVRIGDLGFTYSNYQLRVENCIMSDQVNHLKAQLISQSSLLVNRSGDRFLASYFEHEGTDILVDESILCLHVDKDKILIDFLIMKLFDKLFIEQINLIKKEDQNKDINLLQFKKISIEYFTLKQQEKWVKNRKIELLLAGEKKVNQLKSDLFKGKLKAYADQMRIISSIQHELGNKLPAVLTELKNLRFYLDELSEGNQVYHASQQIYESSFENEQVDSFADMFNRIEAILTHSIYSIDATSDIIRADRSKMNFELVNLKSFFANFTAMHQSDPRYSIQVEFEDNEQGQDVPLYAQVDETQFKLALSNLVENAKRHGFVENRRYVIQFQIGLSADQSKIIIVYKNDGLAFPEGYTFDDFVGYGNYAGKYGHSGIGGYLINRIIENHNGSIRFLTPQHVSDPYKVKFEISIPYNQS